MMEEILQVLPMAAGSSEGEIGGRAPWWGWMSRGLGESLGCRTTGGQCPRLLSPMLRGRGCCCPTATSLGSAGETGDRTGTWQGHVLPAHGCSRGSSPGTAPSPASHPPAGAHAGCSMPVARASLGAAPGRGSHSQSHQVLKRHNKRTETEGKCHQHTVKMGGTSRREVMEGGGTAQHAARSLSGVHEPLACVQGHSQQVLWMLHPPAKPTRSLPAAHRDHERVPGSGEDLRTLVPTVVTSQLGQEELRLDLRDGCHL